MAPLNPRVTRRLPLIVFHGLAGASLLTVFAITILRDYTENDTRVQVGRGWLIFHHNQVVLRGWPEGTLRIFSFDFGGLENACIAYFSLWGAICVAATIRRRIGTNRRIRRRLAGLCPNCGYDLRASVDRCPECGEPPSGQVVV